MSPDWINQAIKSKSRVLLERLQDELSREQKMLGKMPMFEVVHLCVAEALEKRGISVSTEPDSVVNEAGEAAPKPRE